jgi:hypothetical protein
MSDLDKPSTPRVYGQPDDDPAKSTSPADQGMRGEQGDTLAPPDPAMAHEERVAGGRTVIVNEANGVGFAEATGLVGIEAQHRHEGSEK